jgi:hypothetical protein
MTYCTSSPSSLQIVRLLFIISKCQITIQNELTKPILKSLFVGYFTLATILGMTQVQVYYSFQKKTPKTIVPPGKLEGNTMHIMHCAVSHEIVLMGGCNAQVLAV